MHKSTHTTIAARVICLLTLTGVLSACAIANSLKMAVHCQTEQALHELEEAEKSGGLTAKLAILEREAILREAGRIKEAEVVRAKRESQQGSTEKDKADAEKAVLDTVQNIRKEREKQTGTSECI